MAKHYNSDELRRYASALEDSSVSIESALKRTLVWMRNDISDQLSGETAEALKDTAADMEQEISRGGRDLDDIGAMLRTYAALLDTADRKAAEMFQSR